MFGLRKKGNTVAIVGCHRSGTSILAQLLYFSGFNMRDSKRLLVEADQENPTGYWEDRDAQNLNNRALETLGGSWYRPVLFVDGWAIKCKEAGLLSDISDFLGTNRNGFLFKDPRTTVCLPLWLMVNPKIRLVYIIRNPISVANSLYSRRVSLSCEHGLWLWAMYNCCCIKDGAYNIAAMTSYEALVSNPVHELGNILSAFQIKYSNDKIERSIADHLIIKKNMNAKVDTCYLSRFKWLEEFWYLLENVSNAYKIECEAGLGRERKKVEQYIGSAYFKNNLTQLEEEAQASFCRLYEITSSLKKNG